MMDQSGARNLRELLRTRAGRQFETQVALADALSHAVSQTARGRRMRMHEVVDGLICSLCSVVQSQAPEAEWGDVGKVMAEEIERRMTVTGVR